MKTTADEQLTEALERWLMEWIKEVPAVDRAAIPECAAACAEDLARDKATELLKKHGQTTKHQAS